MHKIKLTLLILWLGFTSIAQNILPFTWNIYRQNIPLVEILQLNPVKFEKINLLRSWERQGFSWQDESCVLLNEFHVNDNNTPLQLILSLQCDIKEIYINNDKIAANIPNTFWSSRDKINYIDIPAKALLSGKKNSIVIFVSNLSYTGGLSHNVCRIQEKNISNKPTVTIKFTKDEAVFVNSQQTNFSINTDGKAGKLRLIITDDFHTLWLDKTYSVVNEQQQIHVDLQKLKLNPGFYECVALFDNGTFDGDIKWFALKPESIACNNHTVKGFEAYWQAALKELKTIEPNFKLHKVDSLCSESRTGYVVEMQSLENLTIRGYYFVPKTTGKHPVVLHLPGYSYGFDCLDGFINRKGNTAELALCVRGHGISKDSFNPWPKMTLWAVNACNKETNVYRSIYMDCIRAVDFLMSRDEIDADKIGVAGGSQGGGLSLATAGLYPEKIAACAIFDPFLCDTRDQMKIRTLINREFKSFTEYDDNNCDVNQIMFVQDYIDSKGFAEKIKCPVFFSASLFDDDCPVHCGFAAYNLIKSNKKYKIYPNDSHLGESGQYDNLFYEAEKILLK